MKALTLTQPWATLVAIGAKKIETRSWRAGYRGPIAIHAAFGWPDYAREFAERFSVRMIAEDAIGEREGRSMLTWNERLEVDRGCVLATAQLVAVVTTVSISAELSTTERTLGDYRAGRWAWMFEDVRPLELPVEARGRLGLWSWEPDGERFRTQEATDASAPSTPA